MLRVFGRDEPRGVHHILLGHHGGGGSVRTVVHVRIEGRELHGRVNGGSSGSTDKQRYCHSAGGHLAADLLHPVKGRSDQSADADDVGTYLDGLVQQCLARYHHAEIRHIEPAAGQDDGGYVLAYVVDVALDGGDEELGLVTDSFTALHIRLEHGHRFAHYPGGLYDLREEHPSVSEKLADALHSGHQRTLYDRDCAAKLFKAGKSVILKAL